ncbi:MAG: DUF3244 domain-containing protein [Bacteroides sp.]|nr:DUF3244 domain-containing protein [Bacteroides sp.]
MALFSLSVFQLQAIDDTDIPVEGDPENSEDPHKKHRDYVEPPYCRFSKAQQEVYVSFDYYCGNATVTVTGADGQSWTITSSTMIQPIVCPVNLSQGAYNISITTTSGLAFLGHFTVD